MKFPKAAYLLFALFFLVTKLGVVLNIHYCGGNIAYISHSFQKKGCGMEKSAPVSCETGIQQKSCCDDETIVLQNKDQNPLTDILQLKLSFSSPATLPLLFHLPEITPCTPATVAYHTQANPPPLYQLYCSYIFYG